MNKVQRRFVIDALDQGHKLTEWESQFVNDLAGRDERIPARVKLYDL